MEDILNELVGISVAVGGDKSLVLGSFGNTSMKTADGKFMYIKTSGTALKDMTRRQGWCKLKLETVGGILDNDTIATAEPDRKLRLMKEALVAACDSKNRVTGGPSVESCFHSILGRYVIHLHPAAVLAYACTKKSREKIEALFKNKRINLLWIPYANPGFELAKKIEKAVDNYKTKSGREPEVLVLQNHGLVVSAVSSKDATALVRKVVCTCRQSFEKDKNINVKPPHGWAITQAASMIKDVLLDFSYKSFDVYHFYNRNIARVLSAKNIETICCGSAVTPDELIYAGGPALYLEKINAEKLTNLLIRRTRQKQELPKAFLVKSLGLFVAEQKDKVNLVKDVVEMYLKVRGFSQELGGICALSKKSCDFIVENYA
jgi:rhamnose utilization protein RhaD (predicted bifunctional aldolase and dehydrogenase)